jgi:hypothetical protein
MFVLVKVTHWQTLFTTNLQVYRGMPLHTFKICARTALSDELDGKSFRIYTLPTDFDDIGQREKISTEEDFQRVINAFFDLSARIPLIYIWNEEEISTTPDKLPNRMVKETKSRTSESSSCRDFSESVKARKRDGKCMVCGLLGFTNLQGAHIYDRERYILLGESERQQILIDLELLDIDTMRNLLALCHGCHRLFDNQKIGINEDFQVIITRSIWYRLANPYTKQRYSAFDRKPIKFKHAFQSISEKAVAERYQNLFVPKLEANSAENEDGEEVIDEENEED